MYIPISKLVENDYTKLSYNLYNVKTSEVINLTVGEIKRSLAAGHDIRGFTLGGNQVQLLSWFKVIGTVGGKKEVKKLYTVVKRIVTYNKTEFVIVDVLGKDYTFEKEQLIDFMKNGAVVAGVKLVKNGVLRVSRLVPTEFSQARV